jgi:serine protease Do
MKKTIAAIAFVLACLLLASAPAFAIGFDTEEVYNSVVVVYSGKAMGSGFAIGGQCLITNAHVIDNEDSVYVTTYSGERVKVRVELLDARLDIAVLSTAGLVFAPLAAADLEECKVGDDVYTIGAPNSMAYTLTKGILSAKDRKVYGRLYLQTDAAINTGNSGGPLLTDNGRVLGMNTLKMSDSEGIGLAIPITDVYSFLEGEDISVDGNGAVDEVFAGEPPAQTAPPERESTPPETIAANRFLVALLSCSVVVNIIFAVLLAYPKRRKRAGKADPTERTDFEIDLLE